MEPRSIINADYLDILFDNRNKQYGSYVLRKYYERRMAIGILSVTGAAFLLCAFTFLDTREPSNNSRRDMRTVENKMTSIVFETPKPKIKPEPPAPAPKAKPTVAFTVPVIKRDDIADPVKPEKPGDAEPGLTTKTGDKNGTSLEKTEKSGNNLTEARPKLPVFIANEMPLFNGDMNKYLSSHIQYPQRARENSIEGTVIVQFVVNESGEVSNIKVMRGIGGGCDEEALRVVSNMPLWKPGKQNGQPVKVYYTLPIRFVLQ